MRTKVFAFNRRRVEIIEVVNDCDSPPAFSQQAIDKMRSNESGAASDQNILHKKQSLVRGGKRSATLLSITCSIISTEDPKRRRRFALPAHSKSISSHKSTSAIPNARPGRIRLSVAAD